MSDVKTYRGRTLEELLPQIRSELGPDAIVLRRREGLAGGVGGFFQKHFVEVDARKALPDEIPLEVRNDRATEEGLSTPGIQTLISQAAPFADSLARAESTLEQRAQAVLVAAASEKEPVAAGLYGPQPRVPREPVTPPAPFTPVEPEPFTPAALADLVAEEPAVSAPAASFSAADDAAPPATSAASFSAADDPAPLATSAAFADAAAPFAAPATSADAAPFAASATSPDPGRSAASASPEAAAAFAAPAAAATPAPAASPLTPAAPPLAPAPATAVEKRLVDGGLTPGLASDIVGEAVAHGLPFAQPRALKKLVRSALVRRLPVMADLGPDRRVIAFVGTGGSGKSTAIAHIAAAYSAAGASVAVVALRSPDGGRGLAAKLEPLGVSVLTCGEDVADIKKRLDAAAPLLTLIDTPAASPADAAGVTALSAQLRAMGAGEVHFALPSTLSAQAAEELAAALRPLGLTHVALTRADETNRPGAVVELAIALRRPLSYRCAYDGAAPLDAGSLAQTLLP